VGAQAVDEHTWHLESAPRAAASDADLALDPALLSDRRLFLDAMTKIKCWFRPARRNRLASIHAHRRT
jgi:hypothetical protein